MVIKVLGTGCEKCTQLYRNVQQTVEELGLDAEIQKVESLLELVQLGVMSTPSMMVDGKLVVSGRVPGVKALAGILRAESQR